MTEAPYPEICTTVDEAEAVFDAVAFKMELLKKDVEGRIVNKMIKDREVQIDRRYFIYTGNKYRLITYAFSKHPEEKGSQLFLRAQLLRLDFLQLEDAVKDKPRTRLFEHEVIFGLGYKTPIDVDTHYYWGQMGCLGELPSRLKTSQFIGDIEGSQKRMETFDKNARVSAQVVTWNPKSEQGTIDTDLKKKIYINREMIPDEIKRPKKGLKLRVRISHDLDKAQARDVVPG
jgi:cold shock CspA family protein